MRTILACVLVLAAVMMPAAAEAGKPAPPVRTRGLILLSYPASIVPRARSAVRAGFDNSKWPSGCANGYFGLIEVGGCPTRESALDETLIKTAYYAFDAYTALVEQFGRNAVVLQPANVSVGPDAQLTYDVPDPELPVAVRIDFTAVVSPRVEKHKPSWTSTHGHYFMPAYVVRDSSGRLLAASKGLQGLKDASKQPSVLIRLRSIGLRSRVEEPGKPVIIGTPQRSFNEKIWIAHTASTDGNPPLAVDLIRQDIAAAVPVIAAAAPADISGYAALFQDELARNPAAAELLPEFIRAEAEFISSASVGGLQSLRASDFGASVRERLLAERKQNRDVANASFFSSLLMMSSAMSDYAKGIPIGQEAMLAQFQSQMQADEKIAQMNQGFQKSFAGVAVRQVSLALGVGGQLATVQARSLSELREKFREIIRPAEPKPKPKREKRRR